MISRVEFNSGEFIIRKEGMKELKTKSDISSTMHDHDVNFGEKKLSICIEYIFAVRKGDKNALPLLSAGEHTPALSEFHFQNSTCY